MKTILSSLLIFAVLAPVNYNWDAVPKDHSIYHSEDYRGKHTRKKKIQKEFKVSERSNLKINNSYGNIDITSWEENRVVIEVIITTNGDNLENVEEKLRDIHIDFNQSASGVSAKTQFNREERAWWKNIFDSSNNVNMEINYIVRVPVGNNLDLDNDYGGIYLDKTTGNTKISCDYGKLDIGELRGKYNELSFDYTRNSKIGYITQATIDADYSDYEVEEAKKLNINADYSNSRISKVERLEFNCDYGSIEIGKVKILEGNGDYLSTRINRIFEVADLNLDYGSLKIDKLVKGVSRIDIDTDYAGIKLGYDRELAFNFNVNSSYGNIRGTEDLNVKMNDKGTTTHKVSGSYGSGNAAEISISSNYGNVNFIKQ
ncbi:hypothetical protein [Christiangramia aquimixticola]|uniref:hypothetical protein n=1 Tax=Christiangramia aquimixticola TaxID=1697558 RepID=UPI003AA96D4E